jgi:hypothetical protein
MAPRSRHWSWRPTTLTCAATTYGYAMPGAIQCEAMKWVAKAKYFFGLDSVVME